MSLIYSAEMLHRLAPKRWRLLFGVLSLGAVLAAALEIVGVGFLVPVLGILLTPDNAVHSSAPWATLTLDGWNNSQSRSLTLLLGFGIFFILKNLLLAALATYESNVVFGFHRYLSERLLSAMFSFRPGARMESATAERAALVMADMTSVVLHTTFPLLTIFAECTLAFGLGIFLWILEPEITSWIGIAMLSVGGAAAYYTRRYVSHLGKRRQFIETKGLAQLQQAFTGLQEIFVYKASIDAATAHRNLLSELSSVHRDFQLASALPRFALETTAIIVLLTMIGISIIEAKGASEIMVRAGVFAFVGFRLLLGTNRLIMSGQAIRYGQASLQRVLDEITVGETTLPIALPSLPPTVENISLVDINYSFGGNPLLTNIVFHGKAGEMIAITGSSGSGKSTLLEIMGGLRMPDQGYCEVNGVQASLMDFSLGYVPQQPVIFPGTLRKNIALGVADEAVDDRRIYMAIQAADLETFVRELDQGLDTLLGEGTRTLSGGQRQRLSLARAIYHDAHVLLLDEPTAALDPQSETDIMETLARLTAGRIIILVTHRALPLKYCQKVYELKGGSLRNRPH